MASTWGTNTWGSNEWQDDVISVSLTGLSTTTSVGTVEAFNTKGWGRDDFGNGAWGVEYSVALSGQQADTTLGTAVHGIGLVFCIHTESYTVYNKSISLVFLLGLVGFAIRRRKG